MQMIKHQIKEKGFQQKKNNNNNYCHPLIHPLILDFNK